MVARGCAKFGVSVPSDLFRRDGKALRPEMRVGGEWTDSVANKKGKKEWVATIKSKIGIDSDQNEREFEYDMPAVDPEVGMIIGFLSEGTAAIGCIVRIQDGLEEGTGVGAMWVATGHLPKRGKRRVAVGATRVVFSGGGESHERVIGEWRALDVESAEMQMRANGWAVDRRDGDLEVNITSSERHCECMTKVREDCGQISKSKVPTDNIDAMRKELEGVGIGCGEFEQQADRFDRLANDNDVELLGFSDGSLSGDNTNGGYGWLVAIKSPDEANKLIILAGGGGAALASSTTNVLLNTTRMEALGLAAGMSYARNWKGSVKWYVDNKGVISNFWAMPGSVANDWSKMGDRDVFGYINIMQSEVLGDWDVIHQEGHVEKRKKDESTWTIEEIGNVEADGIAGDARLGAKRDEEVWDEEVSRWNSTVEELDSMHAIPPKVDIAKRVYTVPLIEAWKLPTTVQWELSWDNQVVVGPVATWVRETIQNSISIEYLRGQTAGLFRTGREGPKRMCVVGDMFEMEGGEYIVTKTDGVDVEYRMMDTIEGGIVSDDEGEIGDEEEIVQLIMETEGVVPDTINDEYQPNPDVRLIRNIWTKGSPQERVKNVKFMWGIFACNELLCERFSMVETSKCTCCGVVETPWHVVGECGHAKAVEIRVDWAKKMWELVQAETSRRKFPLDLGVAKALQRMWKVEEGGALRTWQPGATNVIPGMDTMDSTLRELLIGVAQAGSWAVWMGVFTKGWMELLVAGGMKYHRARSLTGKLSQVISESRSAIAKERNESARNARVEKQKEEREELRKEVKELWDRDRRSMTLRAKYPLTYYLESNKRMLGYRNVRRRAEERACAREAREKRQADLRAQSQERKRREQRIADGTLRERQPTMAEYTKKRRVIHDTDSDEEEGGGVNIDDTSGSSSRSVHVVHSVHPAILQTTRQLQVPASAVATSAAAAAAAATTATTLSAPAVAVAPSALPAPDVLLPAAGAALAADTSSTPNAGWYQRLQRATEAAAAKRKARPARRRQQKKPKQKPRQRNQVAAQIGNKRQRNGSGEAETGMEIEDEDDEGASDSGSGGRQSGVDVDRQDGDRQGGDSEGNSRATSRQRLGGGGKAGVLT